MPTPHNNLHDKLFKDTFSSVREVRALLIHFVNPEVYASLNLDTLRLENGSYVDKNLKEYFADIIYTCQRADGSKVHITLLLEHKSYFDKGLPVQLLRYLTEGYGRQYQENPTAKLSLILPILIYHGKQKWVKHELEEMTYLPEEELNPFLPTFKYEVVDLGNIAKEVIVSLKTGVMLSKTLLLFKHKNDKKYVLENSAELFTFVEYELKEEEKKRVIHALLRYIFELHRFEEEDVEIFTKKLDKMTQTIAGSYADTLRKQGVQKGMQKGIEKGKQKESILHSIKSLCVFLKGFPNISDEKAAEFTISSLDMTVMLRKLLKEHTKNTAGKEVLKVWFKDIELDKKEKAVLLKYVVEYYLPEKE